MKAHEVQIFGSHNFSVVLIRYVPVLVGLCKVSSCAEVFALQPRVSPALRDVQIGIQTRVFIVRAYDSCVTFQYNLGVVVQSRDDRLSEGISDVASLLFDTSEIQSGMKEGTSSFIEFGKNPNQSCELMSSHQSEFPWFAPGFFGRER